MFFLLFLLSGLCWFFWPQLNSNFDAVFGDPGDTRLIMYLCEHWFNFFKGEVNFFSPEMFYPYPHTLGYTSALFLAAVPYSIVRLFTSDMYLALQLSILINFIINFTCVYYIARRVVNLNTFFSSAVASIAIFNIPRAIQMNHSQLIPMGGLLTAALALSFFFKKERSLGSNKVTGILCLASGALAAQFMTDVYLGWFFCFWLTLAGLIAVMQKNLRAILVDVLKRRKKELVFGGLFFVFAMIPFFLVYVPVANEVGLRTYHDIKIHLPRLVHFLIPGRNSLWYGFTADYFQSEADPLWHEKIISIGILPLAGFLVAIYFAAIKWRKENSLISQFLAVSTFACLLFVLLSTVFFGKSPWAVVYDVFPGAGSLRAVGRHMLFLIIPIALATAFYLQKIAKKGMGSRIVVVILVLLGLVEQLSVIHTFSASADIARVQAKAASLDKNCQAFYVAASPENGAPEWMLLVDALVISALTDIPTLSGYSGQIAPGWKLNPKDPNLKMNVNEWVSRYSLDGKICEVSY